MTNIIHGMLEAAEQSSKLHESTQYDKSILQSWLM